MQKKKIIAIIPARLQSSRLPEKPLALIAGKPMIQRTFESVQKCSLLDEVYIATDSQKIAFEVQRFKGQVLMTSISCKNGTERIFEAVKKYNLKADIVVNVQGDSPCINPSTISKTVQMLIDDPTAETATACSQVKDPKKIKSPHTVKCLFDQNFKALYFSRSPVPFSKNLDKTLFYHHIGIYAYRFDFLKLYPKLADTPLQKTEDLEQLKILEHGYQMKVAIVDEVPLSVDVPDDILKVEKFLCQKNTSLLQGA
jgi:3-deoxy-manno-octulosonate cytidylyltransferase (CMP-KDO synthetase)